MTAARPIKPFADDSAATAIGDLQVENGQDRIAVYGSLDLTRDKAGLKLAHDLRALLDQVIAVLEGDPKLPAAIPPPKASGSVPNPFG